MSNDTVLYELMIQQAEAKARYDTLTKIINQLKDGSIEEEISLGNIIRNARIDHNYTQKELGALIGYGNGAEVNVSRVENNLQIPQRRTIEKLAEVLDLDVAFLLKLSVEEILIND